MNFFKDKKITLMGLGLLGRGVGDAVFLASHGAELIVTDLKNAGELKPSLEKLKKFKNISYTFGQHKIEDFRNRDLIIKSAGVPLDSPFIREARKDGADIEMSTALFVKLLHKRGITVTTVGVTGTRGKSTITEIIYKILKEDGRIVHLGGNIKGIATLPLIDSVEDGDIVVMELDSWQLQGFGENKISPHVAVFSNFYPDHLDYYLRTSERNGGAGSNISERGKEASSAYENALDEYWNDKAHIFRYQKENDYLIAGSGVAKRIQKEFPEYSGTMIIPTEKTVPDAWKVTILGEHNRENISLAVSVARALSVPDVPIQKAVEAFKGLPERIEFLSEVRGVKYYNDNKATTPEATLAALRTLQPTTYNLQPRIILILGGTDKGLDMRNLISALPKYCKAVVLLNETGTEQIKQGVYLLQDIIVREGNTLREVMKEATELAGQGDIVLYSPAFSSFGSQFKNVYDRGEQFVKIVKTL